METQSHRLCLQPEDFALEPATYLWSTYTVQFEKLCSRKIQMGKKSDSQHINSV